MRVASSLLLIAAFAVVPAVVVGGNGRRVWRKVPNSRSGDTAGCCRGDGTRSRSGVDRYPIEPIDTAILPNIAGCKSWCNQHSCCVGMEYGKNDGLCRIFDHENRPTDTWGNDKPDHHCSDRRTCYRRDRSRNGTLAFNLVDPGSNPDRTQRGCCKGDDMSERTPRKIFQPASEHDIHNSRACKAKCSGHNNAWCTAVEYSAKNGGRCELFGKDQTPSRVLTGGQAFSCGDTNCFKRECIFSSSPLV